jgi:hypothetical protein
MAEESGKLVLRGSHRCIFLVKPDFYHGGRADSDRLFHAEDADYKNN